MRRLLELFVHNWTLKAIALAMAFLLWIAVRSETMSQAAISSIEVSVQLEQEGWIFLPPPRPAGVTVVFEGPVRQLAALAIDRPRMVIPVTDVRDTVVTRTLDFRHLRYRGNRESVRPVTIEPQTVTLRFDRLIEATRPVAVQTRGELPEGRTLEGRPTADPPLVRVSGPSRAVARIDSLRLAPIDLSTFTTAGRVTVDVDTTGLDLRVTPARVDVYVPVASVPDTLPSDTLPSDTLDAAEPDTLAPAADTLPPDTAAAPGPTGARRGRR